LGTGRETWPSLLPTAGGRSRFNPDATYLSWLGAPAKIPGVDPVVADAVDLAEAS
jgi:site-specific DNA recombinase